LQEHGLGHYANLLAAHGFLHRLCELGAHPELIANIGLPKRFCNVIAEKVAKGQLTESTIEAGQPPPGSGWQQVFSQSLGLHYYQATSKPYQTQWECPPALAKLAQSSRPESEREPGHLNVEAELLARQKNNPLDAAPYIVLSPNKVPHCLLCSGIGTDHLQGTTHQSHLCHWRALGESLNSVRQEIRVACESSQNGWSKKALQGSIVEAWRGEILTVLSSSRAAEEPLPQQALDVFWNLVVKPCIPETGDLNSVLESVDAMFRIARAPEPKPGHSISVAARSSLFAFDDSGPPKRDVDFSWFPAQLEATRRLNANTPPEVFDALIPRALLGEGIKANDLGVMSCDYCACAVRDISSHLNPRHLEAKAHTRNREQRLATMHRLQRDGWMLQHQGIVINRKRFGCRICNEEGLWQHVWSHHDSEAHRLKAQKLGPAPEVSAEEREMWHSAFKVE
jgi:hypothetical protein